MTVRGIGTALEFESASQPDAPYVVSAEAASDTSVRVEFDQRMKASDSGDTQDALNPDNYIFTETGGVPIAAASVSLVQASPTIVEVSLDGEMSDGETYVVEIDNVANIHNTTIDTNQNTADFLGQGTGPHIDSAVASSNTTVDVTFNEEMLNNAALTDPANYSFSGDTVLTPASVTRLSGTEVRVTVGEMLDGGSYSVLASSVYDIAENLVTGPEAAFTGIGEGPYLTIVDPTSPTTIEVTFSESVNPVDASDTANYQVYEKGLPSHQLAIASAVQQTPQKYELTLADAQTASKEYTLRTADIEDQVGNVQDPNPDTYDFTGIGLSPPEIIISPDEAAVDVPVRRYVRVTCADVEAGFTGIDLSSVWIKAEYVDENGHTHENYAVLNGAVQPAYSGYTRGSADSSSGVTFYVRPKSKTWASQQRYNISVYAKDNEGQSNLETTFFDTATPECFEDLESSRFTVLEQKLLASVGAYNIDRVREALLRHGSLSPSRRVQARTLLYLANLTDLRGMLAGLVNFTLVGPSVKLCDRNRVIDIYAKMQTLKPTAVRAVDEIPNLRKEAHNLLRARLDNNAPVYVVNAMAVIVVAAIVFGEF